MQAQYSQEITCIGTSCGCLFLLFPLIPFFLSQYYFKKCQTQWGFNSFMTEVPIPMSSANQWTGFYMIGSSIMKESVTSIEDIVRAAGYSEPCQTCKMERFMKNIGDFFAKSSLLDIWLSSKYKSLGCVRKLYPEIFVILGAGTDRWRTERWINLGKNLRAFQTSKSIAYYVIASKCKLHCCLWSVFFFKKIFNANLVWELLKKEVGVLLLLKTLTSEKSHIEFHVWYHIILTF